MMLKLGKLRLLTHSRIQFYVVQRLYFNSRIIERLNKIKQGHSCLIEIA